MKTKFEDTPFIQSANTLTVSPTSFSEQIRQLFRSNGVVDVKQEADKRAGKVSTERDQKAVISTIYCIRKSVEKELGKNIVRKGDVFRVSDGQSEQVQEVATLKNPELKVKTKTAALVVREVRDNQGSRYELDVVGEFNRGMMKEALKQLMEVFI